MALTWAGAQREAAITKSVSSSRPSASKMKTKFPVFSAAIAAWMLFENMVLNNGFQASSLNCFWFSVHRVVVVGVVVCFRMFFVSRASGSCSGKVEEVVRPPRKSTRIRRIRTDFHGLKNGFGFGAFLPGTG